MPKRKADPDPAEALAAMPLLMTVAQASQLLGWSESKGYRAAQAGTLPAATRIGRRHYVKREHLRRWLAGLPADGQEGAGDGQPARPALRVVAGGGRGGGGGAPG